MNTTDNPRAKAITDALWAFGQEQLKVFENAPLKITCIGINRTTWHRLDLATRVWQREIPPDLCMYTMDFNGLNIAGLAWISFNGKHRVTRLFNFTTSDWCDLEEDVHLPDGMVELIYALPLSKGRTAGHLVDITPLLAAGA